MVFFISFVPLLIHEKEGDILVGDRGREMEDRAVRGEERERKRERVEE